MPGNILNLQQYRVLHVEEADYDYHVTAELVDVASACPHCQSDRLTSWGTSEPVFKEYARPSYARQGLLAVSAGSRREPDEGRPTGEVDRSTSVETHLHLAG